MQRSYALCAVMGAAVFKLQRLLHIVISWTLELRSHPKTSGCLRTPLWNSQILVSSDISAKPTSSERESLDSHFAELRQFIPH